MLSRRFFTRNANDKVKQEVREAVRPYPQEDILQDNLQTEVNWDHFRKHIIRDLVDRRQETRLLLPLLNK